MQVRDTGATLLPAHGDQPVCAAVPPELLVKGVLSKAADVYSFGVLMVELWSQSRAWAGALEQASAAT